MTQGITALPGAQQPQAPGQATPFQALPAAQPKTPGIAQTPALSQQSTDALLAMYRNPKLLEGTPYSLYGVIGALSQQLKAEAAAEAAKNNVAMAAYGQQIQQPPVAEGLAQQAAMLARPTQMARHGGTMHGYASGGAVAFQSGGALLPRMPGETDEAYAKRMASMPQQPGETDMQYQRRIYSAASRQQDIAPLIETVSDPRARMRQVEQAMPAAEMPAGRTYQRGIEEALKTASRPDTGAPAAAPAPTAAPTGLNALMAQLFKQATTPNAELARIGKEAEKSAQDTAALLQRMQSLSPEEAAARAQYYKTVEGAYEPQRKSLEAARASTKEGLLQSPEALARLASAFGGAKRVGQGLSAAAGAAGEVLGERRKRAEQLEERYQTLSSQLAITTAQAQRADVEGDEKRKRELMLQAQGLKDRLLATQMDLLKTGTEMRRGDISGLASLYGVQAQMMQAGKPTAPEFLYNLYKKDPKAFEGFLTAQQGPKSEAAERTAMLRALVTEAVKNPLMFQQLPPEMQAIVRQEMAKLGVTSSLPSGANVRE